MSISKVREDGPFWSLPSTSTPLSTNHKVVDTSPKLRKDFPETWIWEHLNENGFVK